MITSLEIEAAIAVALAEIDDAPIVTESANTSDTIQEDSADSFTTRIVVKCEAPTPLIPARDPSLSPMVWQAQATVTLHYQYGQGAGLATFYTLRDEIDAALFPLNNTYPAGVAGVLSGSFPLGIAFDQPSDGNVTTQGENRRVYSRSFRVVFKV